MAIIKPNNNTISAITALPASITTGKVLQAVTNTEDNRFSTTSSSFAAATGYTIAITPSATSSKIFVCVSSMIDTAAGNRAAYATIYRGSTNLGNAQGIAVAYQANGRLYAPVTLSVLDSPSTTSAVTYQVYVKSGDSGDAVVFNDAEAKAQLTAFEIAG